MVWVALAASLWLTLLLVPWRPTLLCERLEADPTAAGPDGDDQVTVLMPARNEEAVIGRALAALGCQGVVLPVIVIDDASTDATIKIARQSALPRLTVVQAPELPEGWTGKLWALEQGRALVTTPYILLLDADICLAPATVPTLLQKARRERLALVSLMAAPAMIGFWDRWLMPAFIYFFKLLYPFRLVNRPGSRWAAAAGGCLLVSRDALEAIGGFGALRGAVIDDCTLAALIKRRTQAPIWVGVSHSAVMMRVTALSGFWRMVARTAFTQLRYSWVLLALCTAVMVLMFVVPIAALFVGAAGGVRVVALLALIFMATSYAPTARFYGQSRLAPLGLPLVGIAFLLMTYTSALWYARGVRSQWKGRSYGRGKA
ncbi:MAG: glycosyltransferase [Acidiferrobacter sp.]